jgi:hypothetical protein
MLNLSSMRFGKLPFFPKAKDMPLRAYLDRAQAEEDLDSAPAAINWCEMPQPDGNLPTWDSDVLGNDVYGDCVLAAPAHLLMLESKLAGSPVTITTDQVLDAYSDLTGFNREQGIGDNGAYIRDMMDMWRTVGLYGDKIDAYLWVNPLDKLELNWALWRSGGLIAGILLPKCWPEQVDAEGNPDWTIPAGGWAQGDGPGAGGGHAVATHATGGGNSWGLPANWSDEHRQACCDELVMPISRRWQTLSGLTPCGLAYDQVLADARARGAVS